MEARYFQVSVGQQQVEQSDLRSNCQTARFLATVERGL